MSRTNQQQPAPLVWTWRQLCARLGVSIETADRLEQKGDWPPTFRIGKQRFARPADVEAWLAAKARGSAPKPKRGRERLSEGRAATA
jgi:predicted DNA-binding transcriptional regulator AlpA